MARHTAANYTGALAFVWADAASDAIAIADIQQVGKALDQHTHNGVSDGLAVTSIALAAITTALGSAAVNVGGVQSITGQKTITLPIIAASTANTAGVLGYDAGKLGFGDGGAFRHVVDVESAQSVTGVKTLTGPIIAAGSPVTAGALGFSASRPSCGDGAAAQTLLLKADIVTMAVQQRIAITPTVDSATHTVNLDLTTLGVVAGSRYAMIAMSATSTGAGGALAATQQGLAPFIPFLQGFVPVANIAFYTQGLIPLNTGNNQITYSYNFAAGQVVSGMFLYVLGYIV